MRIMGTGSALPERVVTNFDLMAFLDTSDEWISTRTGIRERRVVNQETALSLAALAARRAMDDANVSPADIDYILCTTLQGDYLTPALCCGVQAALGLKCSGVDINNACPGFIYGLDLADAYITAGKAKHVLVIASEIMSRVCDWTDRATCVLFGDGAGAAVVGPGEDLCAVRLTCEGNPDVLYAVQPQGNSPFCENPRAEQSLQMAGSDVYRFAVSSSIADIRAVLDQLGVTPDEVSKFVLHQANMRILEAVRTRLHQSEEKFPSNISVRGNTASATVPILLDELSRAGQLKNGDLIVMSAFGAGLTTGACALRWNR